MKHIRILEDISHNSAEEIILEIQNQEDIIAYEKIGFSKEMMQFFKEAFSLKKEKREHEVSWYGNEFLATKIRAFFVDSKKKDLERSDIIRKSKKDILYISMDPLLEDVLEAIALSSYHYDVFLKEKKKQIISLYLPTGLKKTRSKLEKDIELYKAVYSARDLINEPASICTPKKIVKDIESYAWKNTKVKILPKKDLEKLGCNLLLAVSAGSSEEPYIAIFERIMNHATDSIALVGKGVTFDAGGIQIKPDHAMLDMKCDMSGAAGVFATMKYLDTFDKLPCTVIGAVGLTENMTGGSAFKPLDIYKSYNGTSVEIHHTDAEGRLVLADVMGYVEDTYKPKHIITMATLTGACIYALGYDYAGIIGDDEDIIQAIEKQNIPFEQVWRLPLNDSLKDSLKAEIADLKNVSKTEKAGSSVGAAFLSYFQGKAKLTHLDIAGPAYRDSAKGYMPKGGTGWGVRTLSELILNHKGKKIKKG